MAFINGTAASETLLGDIDMNINDSISGQQGDDSLLGLTGNDSLNGGDGDDQLNGGVDDDQLFGGDGEDDLDGSSGNDQLFGHEGGDDLFGSSGDDILDGGRDDDDISGGDGTDTLVGDRGDDDLDGGSGADTMTGGRGFDLFTWAAWRNQNEDFYTFDNTDDDVITDFRHAIDVIDVSSFASEFETMQAIGATVGGNTVFTIFGNGATATLTLLGVTLGSLSAIDFVFDTTGFGDDLVGTAGNDDVFGGIGDDTLSGAGGNDRLFGEQDDDTLLGSSGNDGLWGGSGDDILSGAAGTDALHGGDGTDQLSGGTGRDTLNGGAGADTFDFNSVADSVPGAATRDVIQDFVSGTDEVDLATIDANTGLGGNQAFTFIGAGAFTGVAGQLRYTGSMLVADDDGDGGADMEILFNGAPSVVAGDLVL